MASKAVTIGDLIHRVASSCISNRFPGNNTLDDSSDLDDDDPFADFGDADDAEECRHSPPEKAAPAKEEVDEEVRKLKIWEEGQEEKRRQNVSATTGLAVAEEEVKAKERAERAGDAEALMAEVFDAVSGVRRAYAALQGAHCPWDPDRMRTADAGVVAELRHLARLRDRFRRSAASPGGRIPRPSAQPLREAVAPYEAELDDLRRQLQGKQAEVDGLKEKLATATSRRNARLHPSKMNHHHIVNADGGVGAPTAELFVACAEQARAATRGFAGHLLNLLRAAGLDPDAATRSITKIPVNSSPHLARHALEAHATAVLLGGFEHESFYLDGSLSSLLDPAAFRRERFAQYRDMRGMDPGELLGVLPTCAFGRYAAAKYASLLPPRVEAVLGGEHRNTAANGGAHPRTPFYGEFLRAAKAVWLLHLLAFALEPPPSHFEAGRGAEFHPEYMESVVVAGRGAGTGDMVVGFAVAPGFKLCNAAVVRARVYLVPRGSRQ